MKATLAAMLLFCACTSPVVVTKPGGELISLALNNGSTFPAELLALDDTSVYFLCRDTVWRAAQADIAAVRVEGYSLLWPKVVALSLLAATDAVAITFNFWPWIPYVAVGTLGLAAIDMFATEPKVNFRPPLDRGARDQLELYCRYMQCPNPDQWTQLLGHYGQQEFRAVEQSLRR